MSAVQPEPESEPAPAPARPGREIVFQDLFNVRDLGGHVTRDGRTVREGLWFRGASIHRVAGADIETLRELGIRTAIDLRTGQEIVDHGALPTESTGIEVKHLPLIPQTWERRDDLDDPETATAYLIERFADMLNTGGPAITDTIRALADPETGPTIIYCMAGKDRTGVMTAVVMDLLGVDDDEIARDFHRSHEAAQQLFAWSGGGGGGGDSTMMRQPPPVASAPPEAILGFLHAARQRYGSVTEYVAARGVDQETRRGLRSRLLTD